MMRALVIMMAFTACYTPDFSADGGLDACGSGCPTKSHCSKGFCLPDDSSAADAGVVTDGGNASADIRSTPADVGSIPPLKQRIDAINLSATGPMLIGYGVGLHLGEVLYGNIGALERLDFTVVGPAVNLTARIEGLTRTLNTRLVVSTDFAAQRPDLFTSAGVFELKGFEDPIEVFIPKERLTTTKTEPEDS